MIYNKCGDDKVLFGGKQSVTRVDPCLKLYVGCPIMVSTNDQKKSKIVKGTTGIFKGVVLKADKSLKEELWNDYRVYTIESNDVDYIVCERPNKDKNKQSTIFHLSTNTFIVDVKYEMTENNFVNLPKSKLTQFPILIDLATTGHKLQGMTKKNLIGTANWIYVVLSRVTSIKGLFLLQPLKLNFNPKQSKLLLKELQMQQKMEYETLLYLQKNGNFPSHIDLNSLIPDNNTADAEQPPIQSTTVRISQKRKRLEKPKNKTSSKKPNFEMLLNVCVALVLSS